MTGVLTDRTTPRGRFRARLREGVDYLPCAAVVMAACLAFHVLKGTGLLEGRAPLRQGLILAAVLAVLAPVRARDVAAPLRILHRTILLLFTGFVLISYPTLSDAYYAESAWTETLIRHGRWLAVAAGVLGWWRPGFGLVPVIYVAWKKEHLENLYGFNLNATDYHIVMELMVFICLAIGVVAAVEAVTRRLSGRDGGRAGVRSLGEGAFMAALAIHMANYFYSAVAKITLPGAGPFTWIMENETVNIMMATIVTGLGPLATDPAIAAAALSAMAGGQVVSNAITLGAQLAAVLCVLRTRWALVATLAYDVMHLGIFLTTGILFWKWMMVNVGLVIALRLMIAQQGSARGPPWPLSVMAVGVLVLSPLVFRIAELGWFDGRALNRPSVQAILEDGREVPVPTNFFLEGATQLAKAAIGFPFPGHFDRIGVFGKALDGAPGMRAARTCDLPVAATSGLDAVFRDNPRLGAFFRRHHDYALSRAGPDGRIRYNLFPHHNWSNPVRYAAFDRVDLRDVVAYRYAIDSICLNLDEDGAIEEKLMLRGTHVIEVR